MERSSSAIQPFSVFQRSPASLRSAVGRSIRVRASDEPARDPSRGRPPSSQRLCLAHRLNFRGASTGFVIPRTCLRGCVPFVFGRTAEARARDPSQRVFDVLRRRARYHTGGRHRRGHVVGAAATRTTGDATRTPGGPSVSSAERDVSLVDAIDIGPRKQRGPSRLTGEDDTAAQLHALGDPTRTGGGCPPRNNGLVNEDAFYFSFSTRRRVVTDPRNIAAYTGHRDLI